MVTGQIKSVIVDKGFGFVSVPGMQKDVFFHISALQGGLSWGEHLKYQRVELEYADEARGPKATNIWPAD